MASLKTGQSGSSSASGQAVKKRLLQVGLTFAGLAASLFLSAGHLDWWAAWIYLAFILAALSTPFLLDSLWALIPSLLAAAGIILRTVLEDRTLHAELAGYQEYAQRVRFRLLPGVW